jgi:tRNA1(Val) A37 N6-methylase TrmN6
MANPPYFRRDHSVPAQEAGRERAMGEATALAQWIEVAAPRVVDGGHVTFIQRAERLPELIALMTARLGSVEVLPLIPRRGRAAQLVLIRGRKGGRAPFRLADPVLMHAGAAHDGDRDDYTELVAAVLREGAALPV